MVVDDVIATANQSGSSSEVFGNSGSHMEPLTGQQSPAAVTKKQVSHIKQGAVQGDGDDRNDDVGQDVTLPHYQKTQHMLQPSQLQAPDSQQQCFSQPSRDNPNNVPHQQQSHSLADDAGADVVQWIKAHLHLEGSPKTTTHKLTWVPAVPHHLSLAVAGQDSQAAAAAAAPGETCAGDSHAGQSTESEQNDAPGQSYAADRATSQLVPLLLVSYGALLTSERCGDDDDVLTLFNQNSRYVRGW